MVLDRSGETSALPKSWKLSKRMTVRIKTRSIKALMALYIDFNGTGKRILNASL